MFNTLMGSGCGNCGEAGASARVSSACKPRSGASLGSLSKAANLRGGSPPDLPAATQAGPQGHMSWHGAVLHFVPRVASPRQPRALPLQRQYFLLAYRNVVEYHMEPTARALATGVHTTSSLGWHKARHPVSVVQRPAQYPIGPKRVSGQFCGGQQAVCESALATREGPTVR